MSCRKKANHEKEKARASAFYQGPKEYDPRILYTLSSPSLDDLMFWAKMLEKFVGRTKQEKAIAIYGILPEGWTDTASILVMKQWGATPPCWVMGCLLPTVAASPIVQMVKPVGKDQREQILTEVLAEDAEIDRRIAEVEGLITKVEAL